jgi:predicted dehydrogenase
MLRAAVVGVGTGRQIRANSIGYVHAATYRDSARCRLVACADTSAENLARCLERFEVNGYPSAEALLISEQPDVLSIATYASSHRELVLTAIRHGVKLIWCEKPLALTTADAYAIRDACATHGVRLVVHHYRRYLGAVRTVRNMIMAGDIGEPTEFLSSGSDWDLMEVGTHWLDLLRFFAGDQDVQWVMGQAAAGTARTNFAGVDYGHTLDAYGLAYFAFTDGTRGLLEGGAGEVRAVRAPFRLNGTAGRIELGHDGGIRLIGPRGVSEIAPSTTLHEVKEGSDHPDPYQLVLNALLDWGDGGPEPEISISSAVKTTELYLAAYQSALDSGRVELPLPDQMDYPLDELHRRRFPTGGAILGQRSSTPVSSEVSAPQAR